MARVIDRVIALQPDRNKPRIIRASIEQLGRADTKPMRAAIEKTLANEPGAADDPWITGIRLDLALCDRDLNAAASIAAALDLKQTLDAGFDEPSRDFWLGVVARLKGDAMAAHAAFVRVRAGFKQEFAHSP